MRMRSPSWWSSTPPMQLLLEKGTRTLAASCSASPRVRPISASTLKPLEELEVVKENEMAMVEQETEELEQFACR
ncbi:unnamed protein product [Lampetra planeri]